MDIEKKTSEILNNQVVDRHSFFQLKHFVVGKEPTHQAKLWRCVRELESRKKSLDTVKLEIEDCKDKILLTKIEHDEQLAKESHPTKKDILERQFNRKIASLENMSKELCVKQRYIEEEAAFFIGAFESLSKIEQIKPYDDLAAQTEYWNEKFANEINLRLLLKQNLDLELIKSILVLEEKTPIKQFTQKMLLDIKKNLLEKQNDDTTK